MNLMKINYGILATEIDNFGFLDDWRKYGKNKRKKNSGCDMFMKFICHKQINKDRNTDRCRNVLSICCCLYHVTLNVFR
jgi:hypothetical protein